MKIAAIAGEFPALSESFVRREVEALRDLGHGVVVLTCYPGSGPRGQSVEGVEVIPADEGAAVPDVRPDVLYGTIGLVAQRATARFARAYGTPFVLRVLSGHAVFVLPSPDFYSDASADPLCLGVVVEDSFMASYARDAMHVRADRLHVVPNSIDLERYHPRTERPDGPPVVLGVGRLVEKKGFQHLIPAFRALDHPTAILRIVGYGPLEPQLRALAANHPRIEFLGAVPESALPELYRSADVFVAPCVRGSDGDSDGVPTVVLEALSSGLPVIASDLLSMSEYVKHAETGWVQFWRGLDVALQDTLRAFLDTDEATVAFLNRLRTNARAFAVEHLDIRKNIRRIEAVLAGGGQ